MKKMILVAFALCCLNQLSAQTADTTKFVYCEIVGTQKLLSTKLNIVVDYGEQRSMFKQNWVRDSEGKIQTFFSMVDALNYMGVNGWEFSQAYVVTANNQNVYHYLMKRKNE